MENFIANLVAEFETGKITRRQFCETVALAACVYQAGSNAAGAAPARGFKPIAINHISYACGDYRKARDFYASVLGMEKVAGSDNGREARLMFGPKPGEGGGFLIPRNAPTAPKAKASIDSISYTVADWDEAKIRNTLRTKGVDVTGGDGSLRLKDPFGYDVELADGRRHSAFRR